MVRRPGLFISVSVHLGAAEGGEKADPTVMSPSPPETATMRVQRHRAALSVIVAVVAVAVSATSGAACVMAPPGPPEVMAARTMNYQTRLWAQSESIYVARVTDSGRVPLGDVSGFRATLLPTLQIKGRVPLAPLTVQHTSFTSCGPHPFLDVLDFRPNEFYVVFSSTEEPAPGTILATLELDEIVEPHLLRAWAEAHARPSP